MGANSLEDLTMVKRLSENVNIHGVLRTRRKQDVEATVRAVLQRVGGDPIFAPLFSSYIYASLHHYRPRFDPFDWQTTPHTLVTELADEPRAGVCLKGPYPSAGLSLDLNSENEIVKEKVDGKRRNVPKASDRSLASISVRATYFSDLTFIQAYLDLLGDIFQIIKGEYGHAKHPAIRHGNDFDRIHRNLLDPDFVTWANFLGPELVARLGREQLLSAPAHQVRELPGGSIVLTVAASPLEQLDLEVQERIAHVKAHLGILSPSELAAPEELASFEARSTAAEAAMKKRIEEAFRQARAKTEAEMQRQAEGCVEGARRFFGVRLDFSPQSLAVVDRLIETEFGRQADEETIATAVRAFGAYAGEVVRRSLGGRWHDEEMKGQPVLLNVGEGLARVAPFLVVARRFEHGHEGHDELPAWYTKVSKQGQDY